MNEEKIFFNNSRGQKLAGILLNPTDKNNIPIVILCHGFTKDKNAKKITDLAKIFRDHNIASFRFDFFGHGESEGSFADITVSEGADDILQSIKFVKNLGFTKLALVGSSFGGLTSLIATASSKDLLALACISPVSDYPEVELLRRTPEEIEKWQNDGYIIHKNSGGQEFRLNYSFWQDILKNVFYPLANKINIPVLIVHGTVDKTVPIEQSRKSCSLIKNSKLIEIEGADHKFTDPEKCDQMIKLISEFIIKNLE